MIHRVELNKKFMSDVQIQDVCHTHFSTMAMTTNTLNTQVWQGHNLRYQDEQGTLWFSLSDICKALDLGTDSTHAWKVRLNTIQSQKVRTGKLRNARG